MAVRSSILLPVRNEAHPLAKCLETRITPERPHLRHPKKGPCSTDGAGLCIVIETTRGKRMGRINVAKHRVPEHEPLAHHLIEAVRGQPGLVPLQRANSSL